MAAAGMDPNTKKPLGGQPWVLMNPANPHEPPPPFNQDQIEVAKRYLSAWSRKHNKRILLTTKQCHLGLECLARVNFDMRKVPSALDFAHALESELELFTTVYATAHGGRRDVYAEFATIEYGEVFGPWRSRASHVHSCIKVCNIFEELNLETHKPKFPLHYLNSVINRFFKS